MDTIAALNFGAVIALNIRALGVTEDREVVRGTVRAGWIAGGLLLVIYTMLTHVGALSGAAFPGGATGADTLTRIVSALFGTPGGVLLAAIFMIACFNTCTGLLSCCSEYFHRLLPRFSYRAWVVFFAAVSMLISNLGLAGILKLSVPVLNAIYPAALVLILLAMAGERLCRFRLVYPVTLAFVCVVSVIDALRQAKVILPGLTAWVQAIPLARQGLGWVLPAAAGVLLGLALSLLRPAPRR